MGFEDQFVPRQRSRSINDREPSAKRQGIRQFYQDNRPEMQGAAQLYAAVQKSTMKQASSYSVVQKNGNETGPSKLIKEVMRQLAKQNEKNEKIEWTFFYPEYEKFFMSNVSFVNEINKRFQN